MVVWLSGNQAQLLQEDPNYHLMDLTQPREVEGDMIVPAYQQISINSFDFFT